MHVGVLQIVACYTATILILSIGKPTKNIHCLSLCVHVQLITEKEALQQAIQAEQLKLSQLTQEKDQFRYNGATIMGAD